MKLQVYAFQKTGRFFEREFLRSQGFAPRESHHNSMDERWTFLLIKHVWLPSNLYLHILSSALLVLFLTECLFCCTGTEDSSPLLQGTTQIRLVSFFIVLPRLTADAVCLTLNNMDIKVSLGQLQICPWYRCHIITFKSLALSWRFCTLYNYMHPLCQWNTAFQHHSCVHSEPRKNSQFTTNKIIEHDFCGHGCLVFQMLYSS